MAKYTRALELGLDRMAEGGSSSNPARQCEPADDLAVHFCAVSG